MSLSAGVQRKQPGQMVVDSAVSILLLFYIDHSKKEIRKAHYNNSHDEANIKFFLSVSTLPTFQSKSCDLLKIF
jgi:hypothetical protein